MRPFTRFVAFCLLLTLPSFAQTASVTKDYSKELCVIEKSLTRIKVAEDGSADRHQESVVLLTSQAGVQQFGLLRFSYPKATTTLNVEYVRIRKPDGTLIETSLDAIDDMPADITRQAPEYSDLREKHIAVKGANVGDRLEFAYSMREKSLIPGRFWLEHNFDDSALVTSAILEIDTPAATSLKMRSREINPTIKEQNGRRIYTWSYNVKEIKKHAAEQVPDPSDLIVSTFADWNEIGQWWSKLSTEATEPAPEIASKARFLTTSAKTDEEKARALYSYVSSQFRYIGISFGIGRYQPHPALDVFQNGFGDCKDKYALLASLLKSVGIPSYPALLNVERKIDPDVPSPSQFDHVVLVAKINGKEVWLDPTQEVAPYAFLSWPERDRYSLVMREQKSTLVKSPNEVPQHSSFDFSAEGELSTQGVLKAHMVSTLQGTLAMIYRAALRSVPQSKWQELAQGISQGQGFGGQVTNVEVIGVDDPEKPLRLSYDYERANYSEFKDGRISPPFPMNGLAMREDPHQPSDPLPKEIFLGEPAEMRFNANVKLPSGYLAVVPSDAEVKTDFAEYSNKIDFANNVLHAERHIVSKQVAIPQARRNEFIKFGRDIYDAEVSMVTLHPSGSIVNGDNRQRLVVPYSKETDSANLFEQARTEFVQGRRDAAELTLRQLLRQAPSYPNAHALLASIYMTRNEQEKVVAEFEKEIAGNPETIMSYRMYATYLSLQQHNYKGARSVWARCVKNLPQAADAWESIAEVDSYLENYTDAVTEMKKAIELEPDSSSHQLTYGNLLLKSGDKEQGFATLLKTVEEDPKPDYLNTVAYLMSERAYQLDKAERFAKQAVDSIEGETSRIQIPNITTYDLRRMPTLAAYWDTIGWIYFQEGKFDDAVKYLKASWELSPRDIIGTHLGQAYEKVGKPELALETYALAKTKVPVRPGMSNAPSELDTLLQRASKNRAVASSMRSIEKLQDIRSATLTLAPPRPENGEFYFLFTQGKLTEVQFINGDKRLASPAAIEQIKRAKFHSIALPGSPDVRLIRRGSIVCPGTNSACKAVLFEVNDVRSTDY